MSRRRTKRSRDVQIGGALAPGCATGALTRAVETAMPATGSHRPGPVIAQASPSLRGAFLVPVVLARRVASWPPGTPVTIVESLGASVMVEVADAHGQTLDVLVVSRQLLTV